MPGSGESRLTIGEITQGNLKGEALAKAIETAQLKEITDAEAQKKQCGKQFCK